MCDTCVGWCRGTNGTGPQYGIWWRDSTLAKRCVLKFSVCLAVLKLRDFTLSNRTQKVSAGQRADLGSTEELGDDLGCFGHPKSVF